MDDAFLAGGIGSVKRCEALYGHQQTTADNKQRARYNKALDEEWNREESWTDEPVVEAANAEKTASLA